MSLTGDQILAADDRPITTIPVPAWGGDVGMRPLSGAEADQVYDGDGATDATLRLRRIVTLSLCDASTGARLFRVDQADQVFAKSALAVSDLINAAMRINNLGGEAQAAARKDSGATAGN